MTLNKLALGVKCALVFCLFQQHPCNGNFHGYANEDNCFYCIIQQRLNETQTVILQSGACNDSGPLVIMQ